MSDANSHDSAKPQDSAEEAGVEVLEHGTGNEDEEESEDEEDLWIKTEKDVSKFVSASSDVRINTSALGTDLAHCLEALLARILQVERTRRLNLFRLQLYGWNLDYQMQPADWIAISRLGDSFETELVMSFLSESKPCIPSMITAAFLLGLRQHTYDVTLTLYAKVDLDPFFNLLSHQSQHSFDSINPFSLGALTLNSISHENLLTLARLGRTGPKVVNFRGDCVYKSIDRIDMESLLALLETNQWIEWETDGIFWFSEEALESHGGFGPEAEGEFWQRLYNHNDRSPKLGSSTRGAAVRLLRAARPLLCSPQQHPPKPSEDLLSSDSTIFSPSSQTASSAQSSNPTRNAIPPLSSTLASPILSLPYEILDNILSHISPGCLSSKQHRLVMNYAEDRSRLAVVNLKADGSWGERRDFHRRTNCWRWESEVERVNLGFGYE